MTMNFSAATIRGGTEANLPDIASLLVETWRTTFRGLLPHVLGRHIREDAVKPFIGALFGVVCVCADAPSFAQATLTIATVNNADMIRMQGLTGDFTAKNPDVAVKWVT